MLFSRIKLALILLIGGKRVMQILIDSYVALIIVKRRTISQVPEHLQKAVLEDLEAIGLDGYGNPFPTESATS